MRRAVSGALIASAIPVLGLACFNMNFSGGDTGPPGPVKTGQACIEAGGHCTQGFLWNPCPLCENQIDAESASCPSVTVPGSWPEQLYCCTPTDCGLQMPDAGGGHD
jgi:hypothetical protein